MLEPPPLADEALAGALRAGYGLEAPTLTFLPLGQDSAAWVYRVEARGGPFFLKLRSDGIPAASLRVPRYLADMGAAQVPAPIPTRAGALVHPFSPYSLILYPFIEDAQPLPSEQAADLWRRFGATLRQVHDTVLPPDLAALTPREMFQPAANDLALSLDAQVSQTSFTDPPAREVAAFWRAHRDEIGALVERAASLAPRLAQAAASSPLRLCHADPHWSNVLVDAQARLWLVDWDETVLSLKERDLMFVIGGLTPDWGTPLDTARFFEGYGPAVVDPQALAYFRADWAMQDLTNYALRAFAPAPSPEAGAATRQEAARFFKWLFEPGCIVEKALGSALA